MNRILILGTGALGTLFGARLSAAGFHVSMLGTWPAGLQALQNEGARLVDASGRQHAYPVQATHRLEDVTGATAALVMVKAWQTAEAAQKLAACLHSNGLAITLQNGIGNREALVECLAEDRVGVGTTTTGATLLGPGLVRAGGEGVVSLQRHAGIAPFQDLLKSAGFDVRLVANAEALLWGKLVINAAINPLTAILQVPNGELLRRPAARRMLVILAREVAAVAEAEKIHLPFRDPVLAAEQVARRTAENRSSMLQDIQRGTPTEIDAICGEVVKRGKIHGVPTPLNDACWQLVRAIASGR